MTETRSAARLLLALPDYRNYLLVRFIASLGYLMVTVAVGWHIYDLTRQPLDLGYAGLVQFLPAVVLTLYAGQVADRMSRRAILVVCLAAQTLAILVLLYLLVSGAAAVWPIYLVLVVLGSARVFAAPAFSAMLPKLVPEERFGPAVALSSTAWQTATIAGPALGGVLFAFGGAVVYGICAGLFALSGLVLMAIRTSTAPTGVSDRHGLSELLAGVSFVRAQPMILGALSLDLFAVFLGGATALLPIFARDILEVGPTGLGILRSAPAVGAALIGLWLARFPLERHAGLKMYGGVAVFGVATIVFGLSTNFLLSVVALAVLGGADMVSVVVRQTLVQLLTPDSMRGRVSAVNFLFIGGSNELGEFESGVTAAWFGTVPAAVLGGVGSILVVLFFGWKFPALRRVDRLADLRPVPHPQP